MANRGHVSHMKAMTLRRDAQTDPGDQDVALARWEDEGGASIPFANKPDGKISAVVNFGKVSNFAQTSRGQRD
jgi:hypothetical protein